MRQVIERYVDGWKNNNPDLILGSLTHDCVVIESHGPVYRGKEKVRAWVEQWIAEGSTVDDWSIASFYEIGDTVFFEWSFECTVEEKKHSIEGITVAKIKNDLIHSLREYRTAKPLYNWIGE